MTIDSIWTQRVKELREDGMTYAQIAAAIHLAPSTVGDLAKGKYRQPRADAAIRLAELHASRFPAKPTAIEPDTVANGEGA